MSKNKIKIKDKDNHIHSGHKSKREFLLWFLAILVIVASITCNYLFGMNLMWAIRLASWIVVAAIEVFILAFTDFGKKSWKFLCDSRVEMRKVAWSSRKETMRTTLIVSGLTVLTALILWGVDSILLLVIGWLTGQRG